MALEDILGSAIQTGMTLPLQYGNLYNQSFNPYYSYLNNQANNRSQYATSAMSNYTSLLPMQMEAQKWNAMAPALSGLLAGFGVSMPGLGNLSFDGINSNFSNMMDRTSGMLGAYDGEMSKAFERNLAMQPRAPYMNNPKQSGASGFGPPDGDPPYASGPQSQPQPQPQPTYYANRQVMPGPGQGGSSGAYLKAFAPPTGAGRGDAANWAKTWGVRQ